MNTLFVSRIQAVVFRGQRILFQHFIFLPYGRTAALILVQTCGQSIYRVIFHMLGNLNKKVIYQPRNTHFSLRNHIPPPPPPYGQSNWVNVSRSKESSHKLPEVYHIFYFIKILNTYPC